MDKQQALAVVTEFLEPFRADPYAALVARIGTGPLTAEVVRGATTYQIELECLWDRTPGGDIRVMASIDDGGLRAFAPLTVDFIKSPTGQFVGE